MKFVRRSATIYKQTHTHSDTQEQAQIFTLADVGGHKSCFVCGDAIAKKLRSRCHPQCPHSVSLSLCHCVSCATFSTHVCSAFGIIHIDISICVSTHLSTIVHVCVRVYLLHSLSRFSLFFMNETFVVCIIGALCLAVIHRYYTYICTYIDRLIYIGIVCTQ